jgi:hypothetical protein
MAGEKFTVTLAAKIKDFIASMKKASKSIKNMGMMNRGIVKGLQGMSSAANRTGDAIQTAGQKGRTGFDNIAKSSKKATKSSKSFFKVMAGGAAVIGGLAAAFLGFRKAMRVAEIGAAFQVQARAFANLTANQGVQAEELVTKLRAASKGTLDTMSTITTASRALLLQIPASRLTELMVVARRASKAMGTTVAGAFSDISLGIGRQSRLILDNLGIVVRVGVAYENYARKIGTTAGALTDFEKRQAFLNETLAQAKEKFEASSPDVIDFKDRLDRIRATLSDFGKRAAVVVLIPFIAIAETLDELGLGKKFQQMFEVDFPRELQAVLEDIVALLIVMDEKITALKAKLTEKVFFQKIAIFWGKVFGKSAKQIRKAIEEVKVRKLGKELDETGQKADKATQKVVSKKGFLGTLSTRFEELLTQMGDISGALFGVGGERPSILDVAQIKVKSLNEALKDTTSTAADIQREFSKGIPLIEQAIQALTIQIQQASKLARFSQVGQQAVTDLINQREELRRALQPLNVAEEERVSPEAFVEGFGARSTRRFLADAERNLESMERLVKEIEAGIITIPSEIKKVSDKLFKELDDGFASLPPKLQARAKEIRKVLRSMIPDDTFKAGLNQWVDNFNDVTNRMAAMGMRVAQAMAQGFDDFFFNAITGKMTNLEDAFNNLMTSMLRSLTKFLGDKATQEFMGVAFGATGAKTTSAKVPSFGGGGLFGMFSGLFGGGGGGAGGGGGGLSGIFGGIKSFIGLADGGIASFARDVGKDGGVLAQPTIAALAEKPGKREAVMPLEKFTDLVQPINVNISAIDTRSFQTYMMENKEMVLGTIMGIKGSRTVDGMQRQQRGPF